MNILLNFIPIKSGGGLQVAMNFLNVIKNERFGHAFFILISKNKELEDICTQGGFKTYSISSNFLQRSYFERFMISNILKKNNIDAIYTLFGPPIINKRVISIAGIAYSNLFFPEIKFWRGSWFYRFKKKLIDHYRLRSALNADALVFENIAMKERAKALFNYSESIFIPPSITKQDFTPSKLVNKQLSKINDKMFNVLILASWHPNKKIEAVPKILNALKLKQETNVCFVISVDENSKESIKLIEEAKNYGVSDNIALIGKVKVTDVRYIYEKIQTVMLISLLESFSNNIIEAWNYRKPLIITQAEWSKAICENAAVYVNRDDVKDIASKIVELKRNKAYYEKILSNSEKIKKKFPNPAQKVQMQIEYVEKIYEKKG